MAVAAAAAAVAAVKAMAKSAIADNITTSDDLKKSQVSKILDALAGVATEQVVKVGKFTIPRTKHREKPATIQRVLRQDVRDHV